ncbi:hypothetical protein FB451DRAFT_1402995 [Mycena latifolia]|nr:hypothetical protein FB451DRAFT_1402995 [Mycena latifolia]
MQTAVEIIDVYANTNDPPPDIDRTHIYQLVNEETVALTSLDAEIEIVQKLRTITSPLRLLPPEILSLIFMECPRAEVTENIKNPRPLLAPLLLVQICSRWRRIAMDTSALWTDFQLVSLKRNEPRDTGLLTRWAANASPLPLSLAVECHYPDLLQHAFSQIRGFKALRLQLSSASICALGAHNSSDGVDVENSRVDIADRYLNTRTGPYSAFANSPSLRSFTLKCYNAPQLSNLLKFSLSWSQLTSMHISESLSVACLNVFMQCTNLADCKFGMLETWDDNLSLPVNPATFPLLTNAHFTFECFNHRTMHRFLPPLIFPSLKHLVFESYDETWQWSQTQFSSFQFRSGFTLETLHLDGILLDNTEGLRALFEGLPSLKDFMIMLIGDRHAAGGVFSALTCDSVHSLLPRLERLKIGLFQSDVSLRFCIAMLKSRLAPEGGAVPAVSELKFVWLESDVATFFFAPPTLACCFSLTLGVAAGLLPPQPSVARVPAPAFFNRSSRRLLPQRPVGRAPRTHPHTPTLTSSILHTAPFSSPPHLAHP